MGATKNAHGGRHAATRFGLCLKAHTSVSNDPTLGGAVDWAEPSAPETEDRAVEGWAAWQTTIACQGQLRRAGMTGVPVGLDLGVALEVADAMGLDREVRRRAAADDRGRHARRARGAW